MCFLHSLSFSVSDVFNFYLLFPSSLLKLILIIELNCLVELGSEFISGYFPRLFIDPGVPKNDLLPLPSHSYSSSSSFKNNAYALYFYGWKNHFSSSSYFLVFERP
jgi:hypothetical protein